MTSLIAITMIVAIVSPASQMAMAMAIAIILPASPIRTR